MPTYSIIGYTVDAIVHDYNTSTISLPSDFDSNEDRLRFDIVEGGTGQYLDGDYYNGEVGDDNDQDANIYDMDGNLLHTGQVYAEKVDVYVAADGTTIEVTRVEINGVHVGDLVNTPLEPGVDYTYSHSYNVHTGAADDPNTSENEARADTRTEYSEFTDVPCFVSGTMLDTAEGPMPVDWIGVGDRVRTLDRSWQVVRWRGHRAFRAAPDMPAPIEITPGALGPGVPQEVLRLSPQHRIMVSGPICELYFGAPEVFVAAKHLLHWPGIRQVKPDPDHAYYHLLFDHHEVLFSDGVTLESLFLGAELEALSPAPPAILQAAYRHGHTETARLSLTARQARVLLPGSVSAIFDLTDNAGPEVMAQVA